jgi:hypothetical protein
MERGKRMVTKAKPAVEADEPKPDETETKVDDAAKLSDDELTEKIRTVLKELLPNFPKEEATTEEVVDDNKPVTARQEEARAHSLVSELVAAFKEEFQGDEKPKVEKSEPESKPGPKPGGLKRWVEKNLWGIE